MKSTLFVVVVAAVCGCTAPAHMKWIGVGGSKADGNVILGIDVQPKMWVSETIVTWDADQANAEAARRCKGWGYADAEIFRESLPVQVICHPQGMSPCWSKTYRVAYQCIGEQ